MKHLFDCNESEKATKGKVDKSRPNLKKVKK